MSLGLANQPNIGPVGFFEQDEHARVRAALAKVAAFRELSPVALEDIAGRVRIVRILGGSTVLGQDDGGDALYVVMAGRVKIVLTCETGREVILAILRAGDIFGEMSLFDGRPRSATVVALEPTTVLALGREELLRHLVEHPQTALNLLAEMARRLRRADESIAELALLDVEDRLVRRLVQLAREDATRVPEGMLIRRRPTQQDLASMVGSCRETISRMFNQLVREGVLAPRGRTLLVTEALFSRAETSVRAGWSDTSQLS